MAELPTDRYIVEIALTHDHQDGQRLPDCIQALAVPLADVDGTGARFRQIGKPIWEDAVPITPPVPFEIIEQDTGLGRFLELTAEVLVDDGQQPERIEWSLEGPDDCVICAALVEIDLVSQGRLA